MTRPVELTDDSKIDSPEEELKKAFSRVAELKTAQSAAQMARDRAVMEFQRVGTELANARIELAKAIRKFHPELVDDILAQEKTPS